MTNQEAIRLIRNLPTMCEFTDAHGEPIDSDAYYEAADMAISALQAQEAKNSNESSLTQNGLDTISRQAAIDEIRKCRFVVDAIEKISGLSSAQPEREKGEWTKDCACEICGFKPWYERDIHTLSFCPNCGADLREDQDDQSKR